MQIKLNKPHTVTINGCLFSPRSIQRRQCSTESGPECPAALAKLRHCRLMCEAGQFWLLQVPWGGINVAGIKGSSIPFIEVNNIYYTPLYPVHTRLKLQPAEHLVFNSSSSFCNVLEKHLVARYADFSSRYSH